jgi:aerobic carbon-monoxide dehydrogenase large subunit
MLSDQDSTRMIGKSVLRREDPRLLTGRGGYLDDLRIPGALSAAMLRSPHAHARILGIDAAAARELPGVVAVFTGEDLLPIQKPIPPKVVHPDLQDFPRYPIPTDKVRYVGEPVAVVVATSRYIAEDALELIEVDYEPLPAVASTAAALAPGAPRVHDGATDNVAVHVLQTAGHPDTALAEAPNVVREEFFALRGGGHSMECRGVAARWEPAMHQLTVWDSTQVPHYVRNMLAYLYDMEEDDIRLVVPQDVGGGFGPKAQFYSEEAVIPWVAMRVGAPVKWVEDRQENFVSAMMERSQTHRVEVGFDDDGKLLVLKDVFEHDQGAYCAGLQVPTITATTLPGPYKIPNIHTEVTACYTNMVPTSSVRGAGRPQAVFVMERMMDRVAEYLDLDPAEVRRRNLVQADEFPYRVGLMFRDGRPLTYDSGNYPGLLEGLLESFDYEGARREQEQARKEGRFLGIGLAMYVEGSGLGPYEGAKLRLTNDGHVLVTLAAAAAGQGYQTTYAQIASDAMGIGMEHIKVVNGDTGRIAFGQGTFASRITATAGPSVMKAGAELRERILAVAERMLKISAQNLTIEGGRIRSIDDPDVGVTLREVSQLANVGRHGMSLLDGVPAGLETQAYFAPAQAAYTSGAHAALVEVDAETGGTTILRYVVGHDCGNVINPMIVDGQQLGGFAHGLGNAMYEEPSYDSGGQPQTTSYLDYALPSSMEVPTPGLFHLYTPSPLNPLGVKGAGESGTVPPAAAIGNAVEDALRPLGARITSFPVTPSKVSNAIHGSSSTRQESSS